MSELMPLKIFNDFQNGELDKATAIHYLKTIIENESADDKRLESLKLLNKIDCNSDEIFKILENLLVSDTNEQIRIETAVQIITNYPDKSEKIIHHCLRHETSIPCLSTIYKTLQKIKNSKRDKFFKEFETILENRFSSLDCYEREKLGLGSLERYMGKIQDYLLNNEDYFFEISPKEIISFLNEIHTFQEIPELKKNIQEYLQILDIIGKVCIWYIEEVSEYDDLRYQIKRNEYLEILTISSKLGLKINSENKNFLLYLGYSYSKIGNLKEAENIFQELLNSNGSIEVKENSYSYFKSTCENQALKLIKNGEIDEAIKVYESLIKYKKSEEELTLKLGNLYKELKNYDKGLLLFNKVLDKNPNNIQAVYGIVEIQEIKGDYHNCIELINQTLKNNANDSYLKYKLGSFHLSLGNYSEALTVFKQILEISLADKKIWDFLIFYYNLKGNNKKVQEASNKNLVLEKEFFNPVKKLAYFAFLKGKYNEAIEIINIFSENNNSKQNKDKNTEKISKYYSLLAKIKCMIMNNSTSISIKELV